MSNQKPQPSIEFSLNSISWNLKVISEELKKLNGDTCFAMPPPKPVAHYSKQPHQLEF